MSRSVQAWVASKGYRLPDRTIQECARRMGMDSASLHRYCLQHFGQDFRTWRRNLRIEDAKKELLLHPDMNITAIAAIVGYQDKSNFTKHFQSATGVLPSQWRLMQQ